MFYNLTVSDLGGTRTVTVSIAAGADAATSQTLADDAASVVWKKVRGTFAAVRVEWAFAPTFRPDPVTYSLPELRHTFGSRPGGLDNAAHTGDGTVATDSAPGDCTRAAIHLRTCNAPSTLFDQARLVNLAEEMCPGVGGLATEVVSDEDDQVAPTSELIDVNVTASGSPFAELLVTHNYSGIPYLQVLVGKGLGTACSQTHQVQVDTEADWRSVGSNVTAPHTVVPSAPSTNSIPNGTPRVRVEDQSSEYFPNDPTPSDDDFAAPPATCAGPGVSVCSHFDLARLATATASATAPGSTDASGQPVTYGARNLNDGHVDTAWRVTGDGVGVSVTLTWPKAIYANAVCIIGGYDKVDPTTGEDRFAQNRHLHEATLTVDGGYSVKATFNFLSRAAQCFDVGHQTEHLTVRIDATNADITATSPVNDAAISEIRVEGPLPDTGSAPTTSPTQPPSNAPGF